MNAGPDSGGSLAERVAARRAAHGWSLRELAARSGVSAGMLSEVERGAKSPTVRLTYSIAKALGCSISELVEDPAGGEPVAPTSARPAVRPGPTSVLDDRDAGVLREGHRSPLMHGRLEVAVYTLDPGARSGPMEPNRPGTVESVVVLDGRLELWLDGHPTGLSAGASASHGTHRTEYANPSEQPCRFLVLVDTTRC